jgi:hypothetical protein
MHLRISNQSLLQTKNNFKIQRFGNEMFFEKKNYEEKKKILHAPYQTQAQSLKKGCK